MSPQLNLDQTGANLFHQGFQFRLGHFSPLLGRPENKLSKHALDRLHAARFFEWRLAVGSGDYPGVRFIGQTCVPIREQVIVADPEQLVGACRAAHLAKEVSLRIHARSDEVEMLFHPAEICPIRDAGNS
jgi:hypothetical protein